MRKWLMLVVTVVTVSAGLISSGVEGAVGQAPKLDLIAKPGDLIQFAGSPKVCAVGEATPRGIKKVDVWPSKRVVTFACWTVTPQGAPVSNGRVVFLWQWASQRKSLVGITSWNASATKILSPKRGSVFAGSGGWPAKYTRDPFSVTESQRLGRKAKILIVNQNFRVPVLQGPGFDANIVCDYQEIEGEIGVACYPVDSLAKPQKFFGFVVREPWRPDDVMIFSYDPTCGCGQKVSQ